MLRSVTAVFLSTFQEEIVVDQTDTLFRQALAHGKDHIRILCAVHDLRLLGFQNMVQIVLQGEGILHLGETVPNGLVGLPDESDEPVLDIHESVEQVADILGQLVDEEAISGRIVLHILANLIHRHHAHKAGLYFPEAGLSSVEMDIGADLPDGGVQINIDILCGIAVGDITGVDHTAVAEIRVPTHMEVCAVGQGAAGVKVDIHPLGIIPVDEEPDIPGLFGNLPGDSAADIAAVFGTVIGLQ